MTTAKSLRLLGLALLAAAQISVSAFGQAPPFLGDLKMDIPGSWGEIPRLSAIQVPAAHLNPGKLAIYRAGELKLDGVALTITWKSGTDTQMRPDRITDPEIGLIMGQNLVDHGGRGTQLRLPKGTQMPNEPDMAPQCMVTFNPMTNAVGASTLFVSVEYHPNPQRQTESACLTLYCPGTQEGALAARDFLDKLVVQGQEVGRTLQAEESWTTYFEPYRNGTSHETGNAVAANAAASLGPDASIGSSAISQANIGDLVQKHQNSLVLFEGRLGAGSGFVARSGSTDLVFTNIHVVAADQGLKLRTMTGTKVAVGAAEAAVDHDIMRFRLPDGTPNYSTLELMPDVTAGVKVGDEVAVLGNSEGAGVVQALRGKVVGIGPDRVEIDAQFIPGNSGSPIIHIPSGQVIGIATYIMVHDTSFDGDGPRSGSGRGGPKSFRRFAYRFDSVKEWQPVNWPAFYKQSSELIRAQALTRNVYSLMSDIANERSIDLGTHNDPAIRSQVAEYVRLASSNERLSEGDIKNALGRMFSSLRSACKQELGPASAKGYYDFFWDGFQEEKEVRGKLVESFDRTLKRVGRY